MRFMKCGADKLRRDVNLWRNLVKRRHFCRKYYEEEKVSNRKINKNFDDPEIAFKSKTTSEVIRAYIVYQLLSIRPIVDHNIHLMKIADRLLGDKLFVILMKCTFYGHFVAGEDETCVLPIVKRMHSFGVNSILDYSVEEDIPSEKAENLEKDALEDAKTELPQYKVNYRHLDRRENATSARTWFYQGEAVCDQNADVFLRCVESAAEAAHGTGMVAIKTTALCRPKLLLRISEAIAKSRLYVKQMEEDCVGETDESKTLCCPVIKSRVKKEKFENRFSRMSMEDKEEGRKFLESMTSDSEGVIHLFPWSGILDDRLQVNETFKVPDLQSGKMVRFMSRLSKEEEIQFENMISRLDKIICTASNLNVKITIDAEQTYFQPAISRIAVEMMRKYNKKKGIVFNTYQNYLLTCHDEVMSDLEQARRQNFFFACKLVRGAYMDQERTRAKEMNYPDPIQPTYEATTANYHKTLIECLKQIKRLKDEGVKEKKMCIMVATHNEDTVRLAIEKMEEIGIEPQDGTILFGQLLGMRDFVSFALGHSGYGVYKYVPYGPVKQVLPYLSRRAVENRGVLKNVKKEKAMLAKEIFARIKKLDCNRNPVGHVK